MTIRSNIVAATLSAFAFVGLGGCASAGPAGPSAPVGAPGYGVPITGATLVGSRAAADGVLDELPAHPPAGTCYARVKVMAEGPPPGARAVWRLTPGLPGAMGPTWCLVLEQGQPAPPPPERFGWVKVLCDVDATPERVRMIQTRLHAYGAYHGEESGRYDQATADAVARFQRDQHIDHGGYLSLQTVEAIERAEVRRAAATGGPIRTPCCEAPLPPPPPPPVRVEVPVPQPYTVQVLVPQPYPVYVPVPQPCCVAPPPPQPCCQAPGGALPGPGPGPGYGAPVVYGPGPGYGGYRGPFLTWPGKTVF